MNKFSMRLLPVACAAGLLLSACGGGGGGSSGPTSPGLSRETYQAVAEPTTVSALATANVTAALNQTLDLDSAMEVGNARKPFDALALLKRVRAQSASGRERAQQTESYSEQCSYGGSIAVSASFRDVNAFTPGDSLSLTADKCVAEGIAMDGGFDVTVSRYSATPSSESATLALNFRNLGAAGTLINGGATLNVTGSATGFAMSVGFNNATVSKAGASIVLGYTFNWSTTAAGSTMWLGGDVTLGGHTYTLSQSPSERFRVQGGRITGGTLLIQESPFNERVRVKAGTSGFTYEYYSASNTGSTPDYSSAGLAY